MPWPFYPQERTPVLTEQELGWAPQPIWKFSRYGSLAPARFKLRIIQPVA